MPSPFFHYQRSKKRNVLEYLERISQGSHLALLEGLIHNHTTNRQERALLAIEDLSRAYGDDSSQLDSTESGIMFCISDLSLWLAFGIEQSLD